MKKNKAMRAAGALLVATMLTTCMTAGTLAKYTTGDRAYDGARVAKFGVQIVANGSLFGPAYNANGDQTSPDTPVFVADPATGLTVVAAGENKDKVVAPGTKNDNGLGFAVTGTPEVDVQFTGTITTESVFLKGGESVQYGVMVQKPTGAVTAANFATLDVNEDFYVTADNGATFTLATVFDADATYFVLQNVVNVASTYYPVVYTLTGDTNTTGTTTADSAKAAGQAMANALATSAVTATPDDANAGKFTFTVDATNGKTIKANTDLTAATAINLDAEKITWAWAFTGDNVDEMDTILGDLSDGKYVVKMVPAEQQGEAATYAALEEGKDYSLTTGIDFNLNATQVD